MSTIPVKRSLLTSIVDRLVETSRRDGSTQRAGLAGGAQLVVEVRQDVITMTIKRAIQPVGSTELTTLRRHARIPDDAQVLTPDEQGTRVVDGTTWQYVTYRWRDPHAAL